MALLAGDAGKPTTSPEKPWVFLDHLASFGKNAVHLDGRSGFVFAILRIRRYCHSRSFAKRSGPLLAMLAVGLFLRSATRARVLRIPPPLVETLVFADDFGFVWVESLAAAVRNSAPEWVCFHIFSSTRWRSRSFAKRSGHGSAMPRRGFVYVISHLPIGFP